MSITSDIDLDTTSPAVIHPETFSSTISRQTWKAITSMVTAAMIGVALIIGFTLGITAPAVSPVEPAAGEGVDTSDPEPDGILGGGQGDDLGGGSGVEASDGQNRSDGFGDGRGSGGEPGNGDGGRRDGDG